MALRHTLSFSILVCTASVFWPCSGVARSWTIDGVQRRTTSEGALTLETALSEALSHSPTLQKAEAQLEENQWRRYQAFATGFLPKISVTGTHSLTRRYTYTSINFTGTPLLFPGFYPTTQAALDISVPVFDGLANVFRLQAASRLEEAAERELSRAQFRLAQEVRLAFYQALAADELDAVAEQNVKTLQDHLQQVRVKKQGGIATRYDALRVEVQLSEARSEAVDAKDNCALTRKKLTLLLGLDEDTRELSGTLPTPEPKKVEPLEVADTMGRGDIAALSLRAEAAGYQHDANGSWLFPSVSLFAQGLLYNSQLFDTVVSDTGVYKTAYNVGIRVQWNIFDGGAALADARASAYHAAQKDRSVQEAKRQIPYDLAFWKRRYLSNAHHYESKKLNIDRSQESVRLAKAEERAGTRTASDTLDALLDLFRARAGVLKAQVNTVEAQINLELAVGRNL